jgi:hypothetical protein
MKAVKLNNQAREIYRFAENSNRSFREDLDRKSSEDQEEERVGLRCRSSADLQDDDDALEVDLKEEKKER